MIPTQIDTHCSYQQRCRQSLQSHYKNLHSLPARIRREIHLAFSVDFSSLDRMMIHHCSKYGPAPRPASRMLRSLLLSVLHGTHSITKWVNILRSQPIYAIISGFDHNDVPGVGTFYDFISRLWLSDDNNLSSHIHLPRKKVKKPKHKGEKADSIEKVTVASKMENYINYPIKNNQAFSILFKVFEQFLTISHTQGLINLNNLFLAGDGTPVVTARRYRHRKLKDLEKSDSTPAETRYFSQPDCDIGWDSSRECFYFGYNLYLLTDVKRDLPIFPILNPASKHDSLGFLDAWFNMKYLLPNAKVTSIALDSAHDVMAYYKYFQKENITPYIDLNKRAKKPNFREGFHINEDGYPVCPLGKQMIAAGTDYTRMRIKYTCPLRKHLVSKTISTCNESVTDNIGGCSVYLFHKDNPRYFNIPARTSSLWKQNYNKRTSSERCNKRIKIDFKLEDGKYRSSKMWYFRLYCIMMCQHLNAWSIPMGSEPWMN